MTAITETATATVAAMSLSEFEVIERLLAPLTLGRGEAFGLRNDAALLPGTLSDAAGALVMSMDTMCEGVHFLSDDPRDGLGAKLLRCNLSDMAAMGAEPVAALASLSRGASWDDAALADFARGLGEDLERFGVPLLGGDLSRVDGATVMTMVILGRATGPVVRRDGARTGDVVWVSGELGCARLGLEALRSADSGILSAATATELEGYVRCYRYPEPRLGLGVGLADYVSAGLDVSDGVVSDAGRIAEASGVTLDLEFGRLPFCRLLGDASVDDALRYGCAGDDYELLFTAPSAVSGDITRLAAAANVDVTVIGVVGEREDAGVVIRDSDGAALGADNLGWKHF
ncbi:MAG: thiamine-phosphate kinase [Alphaproteobacteria bacterium]|nr:thiamine-phosphate kinase [Alphaproteobacteria bacterium]